MGWQLKTRKDQYRFTAVIAGIVLVLTGLLRAIFLPFDISAGAVWPGVATALVIAVPITWIVGQRLRDMQTRSAELEHALDYDLLTGVHSAPVSTSAWTRWGTGPAQ